jgi:threonine synthase
VRAILSLSRLHLDTSMRYRSTRGDESKDYSFEQALLSGYAPDGGLFVPASLPSLTAEDHLIPWSKLAFPELAYEVLVRIFARWLHFSCRFISHLQNI